jgi:FkbM family methyltransferase
MTALSEGPEWGAYAPRGIGALALRIAGSNKFARSAKKQLLRCFAGRDGIVDVAHNGLRMRCHMADNATERNIVISGNRQNGEKLAGLLRHVPEGGTFVDVGANCGLFTLTAAARVGGRGRVVAIEPAPVMVERLRFNVAANRFANVMVFPTAVGEATGVATLSIVPGQLGKSSLAAVDGGVAATVPVTTLLSVVEASGIARIDALKIDIEGYEDRALQPFIAAAPLGLWPRAVLMETKWSGRWKTDCLGALVARGYAVDWHRRGDALLVLGPQTGGAP